MTDPEKPRVTVGIPVFNGARFIAHAIESSLAQSWQPIEVIVVDDGSTDRTPEILESYRDRVTILRQSNQGAAAARNRVLLEAKGDWIQYLDSDDSLKPWKIERQWTECSNPNADAILSPLLEERWARGEPLPIRQPEDEGDSDPIVRWFQRKNPQVAAGLWRKQALVRIGGWNRSVRCATEDNELYLRALQADFLFAWTPTAGAVYRADWSQESFSHRNHVELFQTELSLLDKMAAWLQERQQWTAARREAAAQAYFQVLREIAKDDPKRAARLYQGRKKAGLVYPCGPKASPAYCALYGLFGFEGTERICRAASRLRPLEKRFRALRSLSVGEGAPEGKK
ncbi:Putative glycosyltransferase EpsH [Methylacidimicrobium cyclopophantes]|uniref:Glycosyltransferase EpsH n=1 Tax=Methylacidimicrobium cyclopophantes TaxID=1041766 RepID=A0A5E6MJ21_9BACT|nr:glycosyltransferase family A protein [Methylacidimicrobium cyclopophantes]VVM05492.1 Putative glycosyltransferase EpsH [Methylacidimicrobium cyclopophantes]